MAPALLTRTSGAPSSSSTRRIAPSTAALSRTSAARARPPPASSQVSRAAPSSTSSTATVAPSAARRRQIASPIPVPPPVTTDDVPVEPHRDGHQASVHLAALESAIHLDDVVEADALDLDRDVPSAGERHHVEQLLARAPVREGDGGFEGHRAEAHRERPSSHADHGNVPARAHSRGGERQRRVGPDAVHHERRPGSTDHVAQLAPVQLLGLEHGVGADLDGQVERLRPAIDGQDAGGREPPQELDGDVSEPADADHDRRAPRAQDAEHRPDRVVRRQRRVRQRRCGRRVQPVHRRGQPRRGHRQPLREPAVEPQPSPAAAQPVGVLAQGLGADAARTAAPAAPRPVDDDRLAALNARRPRTELHHGAHRLMSERERQLVGKRPGGPVHEVKVGVAQARGEHLEHEPARGRDRLGDLAQLRRPLPRCQLNRAHRCRSSFVQPRARGPRAGRSTAGGPRRGRRRSATCAPARTARRAR